MYYTLHIYNTYNVYIITIFNIQDHIHTQTTRQHKHIQAYITIHTHKHIYNTINT